MSKEKYLRQREYRERMKNEDSRRDYRYDMRGDNRRGYDRNYMMDERDRDRDNRRNYNYNLWNEDPDNRDYRDYRDYRDRDYRDYRDYDMARGRDRDYDRDYASDMNDKEYHEDLKEWVKKLKKHDRFSLPKDQVIETAKQMEVKFDEYDEEEYYAIYLMHISDYPAVSNDARMYMGMAKAWLEDKDLKIEPSEKVCKYLYEIVLAEE